MLSARRGRPVTLARRLAIGAACLSALVLCAGEPALAAGTAPPATVDSSGHLGVTVSWTPTTSPVDAIPGKVTHGTFWVTNETTSVVPVVISPATAVPGDNGSLGVKPGADPRFPTISYSPQTFTAQPNQTVPITVTVNTPPSLAPGVYLVPAVVRPVPKNTTGNIKIQQEIDALVTFQVPGKTKASVKSSFVGPSTGPAYVHVPGLPELQLGTSGSQTLRILDDSPSSFYAYNEIVATQTPSGKVVFKDHTPGDPGDLRNPSALYFPGRYRDYPITWSPSSMGIGVAHIAAYVTYHPSPTTSAQVHTSTELLVVSPWWILVLAIYLLFLLAGARRRGRRQVTAAAATPRERTVVGRIGQVLGSVVMILIVVEAAFLSSPLLLAIVGVVGALGAVAGIATARRCDRAKTAQGILRYELVAGPLVVVGVVLTVLAGLSDVSADFAVAFLAGAGIWSVLSWWMLWWNEERKEPVAPPPASEPPAEEPVPVPS